MFSSVVQARRLIPLFFRRGSQKARRTLDNRYTPLLERCISVGVTILIGCTRCIKGTRRCCFIIGVRSWADEETAPNVASRIDVVNIDKN